jgi:nicotinate-nucleotide pyrophosphorylase (carboxylating)
MALFSLPSSHLSLDDRLRAALAEDLRHGDATTEAIFGPLGAGPIAKARIVCKKAGVLAGLGVAGRVFALVDSSLALRPGRNDGDAVSPGDQVLGIEGPVASILAAERTALNLLQRLSGVATLTRAFVEKAGGRARILDTRKTTPLWRDLEKSAVAAGGGFNHRMGLFDAYMAKDNHVDAAGGVAKALEAVVRHRVAAGEAGKKREIVLEVRTLDEVREALESSHRPDVLLLDNMRGATLRAALDLMAAAGARSPASEISGGVTLDSVESLAAEGVDRISVGALTHSAPALDFSLTLEG